MGRELNGYADASIVLSPPARQELDERDPTWATLQDARDEAGGEQHSGTVFGGEFEQVPELFRRAESGQDHIELSRRARGSRCACSSSDQHVHVDVDATRKLNSFCRHNHFQ